MDVTHAIIDPTVTEICDSSFQHRQSLKKVSIKSLQRIHRLAFGGCSSLQYINLPPTLLEIGQGAFRFCTSLTTIQIPPSVTEIGEGAFAGCTSLQSVTLPSTPTSTSSPPYSIKIGQAAFHGCSSLISIVIPNNCTITQDYNTSRRSRRQRGRITNSSNRTQFIQYPPFEKCSSLEKGLQLQQLTMTKTKCQNHDSVMTLLKSRFDNLPLHRLCYDSNITIQRLQSVILSMKQQQQRQQKSNSIQKQMIEKDELHMTALHVLICNTKATTPMIQTLLDNFTHLNFQSSRTINGMTAFQLFLKHNYINGGYDGHNKHHQRLYTHLCNALRMGLKWDKIEQMFLLNQQCFLALGGDYGDCGNMNSSQLDAKDDFFYPCLQAAILPQCTLEVVFHLTKYSVNYLCI
jgi:hypothetical protein